MKMNLPSIRPQSLLAGCALLAPVLLVQIVRMVFASPGPATAAAETIGAVPFMPGTAAVPTDPIMAATPRLDVQQRKVVEWLKEARSQTTAIASPFPAVGTGPKPTVVDNQPNPTADVPLPAEIRSLALTSVLRASKGSFATLSGKVVRVGDVIVEGWTVTEIDTEKRMVTVKGPNDRTVTVKQDKDTGVPAANHAP